MIGSSYALFRVPYNLTERGTCSDEYEWINRDAWIRGSDF